MQFNTFGRIGTLVAGILALSLQCSARAATVWGQISQNSGANRIDLLMVADDATGKVYLQLAGPTTVWFAWGFGGQAMNNTYAMVMTPNAAGPLIEERRLGNHTAGTALTPTTLTTLNRCNSGGRAFISVSRPLISANRFTFTTGATSVPMIWAVGSTATFQQHPGTRGPFTFNRAAAPAPRVAATGGAQGTFTLHLTNLIFGITNYVEVSTDLEPNQWHAPLSLFRAPPCGSPLLGYFTNMAVSTQDPRAFYRLRR